MSAAQIIAQLKARQRERVFCIKMQQRIDRATDAFIAGRLGYDPSLSEKERNAKFKAAANLRRDVERGEDPGAIAREGQLSYVLAPLICASAKAREQFDALRDKAEREMKSLVRQLPVYPWVASLKGFGDLGLAVVLAEAGDLSRYPDKGPINRGPACLWKRLGLAVIDGERQRKQRDTLAAAAHGYNPHRRAQIFACLSEPLFRHQWRAEKDGRPAGPKGPYGEIYQARRARTASTHPDWKPAHAKNDALRLMTKRVLEDLWRAWRRTTAHVPLLTGAGHEMSAAPLHLDQAAE